MQDTSRFKMSTAFVKEGMATKEEADKFLHAFPSAPAIDLGAPRVRARAARGKGNWNDDSRALARDIYQVRVRGKDPRPTLPHVTCIR